MTPAGSQPRAIAGDWYASAFDALYPVIYGHRSVEAAAPETAFAARALGIAPNDRVLDLCCGNGRHLVHLADYTPHAVGLDYSPDLLFLARRECRTSAARAGRPPMLVRGDMRALPFAECFDAACNFFTSFGYFPTMAENREVAVQLAAALRPAGRFLVDYLNPEQLERTLEPHGERQAGAYTIAEERWIDHESRRINKRTEVWRGGQLVARSGESVQLYRREELTALLEGAGLRVENGYGGYDGAPIGPDSPRMILAGRKA